MDNRYNRYHYNYKGHSAPTISRRNAFNNFLYDDDYRLTQSILYNNRGNNSCYTCTFPPSYFAKNQVQENFSNYYGKPFYR